MNIPQQQKRLYYLDAARCIALILGIVFHASLSFMPVFIGWAVMDISTSHVVSVFVLISHSFRMPLFFLIAGFFSHMTLEQRGTKAFFTSRLMRIAFPFLAGWFLLRPLLVSGWIMGAESIRGDVDVVAALSQGFATLADIPKDLFVGTHLWFLYYLLLITISTVLVKHAIGLNTPLRHSVTRLSGAILLGLCRSRLTLVVIILPTAACLWFMQTWGMDTPDRSLAPDMPVLAIYSLFFIVGWLFHRQPKLLDTFTTFKWKASTATLLAIGASIVLASYEMQPGHPQFSLLKIGFAFSYALMMWLLASAMIALCRKLFNRESKVVCYMADASYWLYLIHLPIVIWLQIIFAELPFNWLIKLTSISLITPSLCLFIYDIAVRPTFIGRLLNGKRRQSVLMTVFKAY